MAACNRNKQGFTLVELIIVVAIIGILVSVAIPLFTSQSDNARTAADESNARTAYAVAITVYVTEMSQGTVAYVYDAARGSAVRSDKASSVAASGGDVAPELTSITVGK